MKKLSASIAVGCLVLVAAVCAFAGSDEHPASSQVVWQHLALSHDAADVTSDSKLSQRIVKLGEEGWELVSVSTVVKEGTTEKTVLFFKRPKQGRAAVGGSAS